MGNPIIRKARFAWIDCVEIGSVGNGWVTDKRYAHSSIVAAINTQWEWAGTRFLDVKHTNEKDGESVCLVMIVQTQDGPIPAGPEYGSLPEGTPIGWYAVWD